MKEIVKLKRENEELCKENFYLKIKGIFHGHVRSWDELSNKMKAELIKAGMVNKKGKIIK